MSEVIPICWGMYDTRALLEDQINSGPPCLGTRIRIVNLERSKIFKRGEPGELHLGCPQVIKGYLMSASTERFYEDDQGHWLKSGGQAIMNNKGQIFILGRYKDIIIQGGENITPALIEAVLGSESW